MSILSILEPRCQVTTTIDCWPHVRRCENRGDLLLVGDRKMCPVHQAERAAAMATHPSNRPAR